MATGLVPVVPDGKEPFAIGALQVFLAQRVSLVIVVTGVATMA